MKIIGMILLCASIAFGAVIKWEKDYNTALKKAKTSNKPLMFIISDHDCRYCVQLETTTLINPKVVQKVNADFIPAVVYMDQNPIFPRDLYVGGTPSTWFLYCDGEPMFEPVLGAVPTERFLHILDVVKAEYKKSRSKK